MLKKTLIALSLAAPILLVQPASARSFDKIYTECGLGGLIGAQASNTSTGNILAIITNVTWDLGTTAITSELSSPDACAGGNAEVAAFIYQSYDALEQDLASGQGQHLDTLKELSGAKAGFESELRLAFANEVASADYAQRSQFDKSEALFNIVSAI